MCHQSGSPETDCTSYWKVMLSCSSLLNGASVQYTCVPRATGCAELQHHYHIVFRSDFVVFMILIASNLSFIRKCNRIGFCSLWCFATDHFINCSVCAVCPLCYCCFTATEPMRRLCQHCCCSLIFLFVFFF